MYKILWIFIACFSLNAYELPQLELPTKGKPEIVFFNAENTVVQGQNSYILKWQTINATDVNITFLGDIELSGTLTITEDEYNHGEIVLCAWNKTSEYVDCFVINSQNSDMPPPVVFNKSEESRNQQYYNTMPYRGVRRPYIYPRRRFY